MSSDEGTSARDTTRTGIAVLVVAGLVLMAAVLPAIGGQAPGSSLVPGNPDSPGASDPRSALDRPLGESGDDTGSLVDGLVGQLPAESPASLGERIGGAGSGSGGTSDGASRFGALDPGRQTGVGSRSSPLSESLRNQSTRPHFVVRSSEPSYWRTGAFGRYTGTGWRARGVATEREWPLSVTTGAADRRPVTQRYTLLEPASSLPAAWQPTDVVLDADRPVTVTQRGGLRAPGGLARNTSYTVVSRVPPTDVERLRTAGRDYPRAVANLYTQLPDDTPARVGRFTDELTANASSPYGAAVRIERWLERNKTYSLTASHSGGPVADQFVFEMDRGYCEYFATSMVVMLRTQGIPARYAVGYSTGQPRGNDTYLVRAMNAHAWVEVYFPDTGWVRFDPTPGRSRLASEARRFRRAVRNGDARQVARRFLENADDSPRRPGAGRRPGGARGAGGAGGTGRAGGGALPAGQNRSVNTSRDLTYGSYNHTEAGSPGESFDPTSDDAYRVDLQGEPVPGRPVQVQVTRGGSPATGVVVLFNGDRVGRTDGTGVVEAEVPFAEELVVTVRARNRSNRDGRDVRDERERQDVPDEREGSDGVSERNVPPLSGPDGAGSAVDDPRAGAGRPTLDLLAGERVGPDGDGTLAGTGPAGSTRPPGDNTSRRYDLPTRIEVTVDGTLEPGSTVSVRALLGDAEVPRATVHVDGERVGRTGGDGRLAVALPNNETATLTVRRGAAAGNRTLRLADVSVNVSGFALPGLTVTATVTDAGRPVEGATVAVVGGDQDVRTGPDGTATLSLPLAASVTLRAETPAGVTETTPVRLRFLTAGVVLASVAALAGAVVVLRRRTSLTGRAAGEEAAAAVRWLSGAFVALLVGLADHTERLFARLPRLVARGVAAARRALSGAVAAVAAAVRRGEPPSVPGPRALLSWLRALVGRLRSGVRSSLPGRAAGDTAATPGSTAVEASEPLESTPTARERIRTAWRDFRSRAGVEDHRTKTPGEVSRRAVADGFPRSPVRRLTDAVRAVEYGERDPHQYVDAVATAVEELDSHRPSGESDGDSDHRPSGDGSAPDTGGGDRG